MPRSFRVEQTFSAATEPGEDLKTNLDARAPGFGAESVSAELSEDEWTVKATFHVGTREEAEARMGALLERPPVFPNRQQPPGRPQSLRRTSKRRAQFDESEALVSSSASMRSNPRHFRLIPQAALKRALRVMLGQKDVDRFGVAGLDERVEPHGHPSMQLQRPLLSSTSHRVDEHRTRRPRS
jgi:hypothetical protein